jgi:hypothetical protein
MRCAPKLVSRIAVKIIYLYPNPNHRSFKDNWVCEHIPMQVGTADGQEWLCDACEAASKAGAQVVKMGRAVSLTKPAGSKTPPRKKIKIKVGQKLGHRQVRPKVQRKRSAKRAQRKRY